MALFTPIALLSLAILIGLFRLWRGRNKPKRPRLAWVGVPAFLLYLLSIQPATYLALGSLEWRFSPNVDVPSDAKAIVVLGGSFHPADWSRPNPELGPASLDRCLHAAALWRSAPDRLVIVSGGHIGGPRSPTGAAIMRDFLVRQGVNPSLIVLEESSTTTYENAVETARILRERSIGRVVLVTDASHMLRSERSFRGHGVDVVPSPCGYLAIGYEFELTDLIPDAKSIGQVDTAWHEWIGLGVYWARGRL